MASRLGPPACRNYINTVKYGKQRCFNKNAVLKIDDTTWGLTNKGVWSKDLNTLKGYMQYTEWSEYKDDTVLDIDNEK